MNDKNVNGTEKIIKKNNFFMISNGIFDIENDLTAIELVVYFYLNRLANNHPNAYPSHETIAKKCKISKRSSERSIKKLVDIGLVKKIKRFNKSNIYEIFDIENIKIASEVENSKAIYDNFENEVATKNKKETKHNKIITSSEAINNKKLNSKDNNKNSNFEKAWKIYPCKKGKGFVKKENKEIINTEMSFNDIEIEINKYLSDKKLNINGGYADFKNGSTFFNKLVENFKKSKNITKEVVNIKVKTIEDVEQIKIKKDKVEIKF